MKIIKTTAAFLVAVITTTIAGCIAATQFILAQFPSMNIDIPLKLRVETTLHDIIGMSPAFSPIVAAALLVAFLIAALLTRFVPIPGRGWYLAGGFVAMITALVLVKTVLGGTPIAGARSGLGLFTQGAAGLLGGWVFARMAPTKRLAS